MQANRRLTHLLAALLLALFAIRSASSSLVHSSTFDEVTFGPAGALLLARALQCPLRFDFYRIRCADRALGFAPSLRLVPCG